jgi:hypothetical protein
MKSTVMRGILVGAVIRELCWTIASGKKTGRVIRDSDPSEERQIRCSMRCWTTSDISIEDLAEPVQTIA